jgi:hypothetical protein
MLKIITVKSVATVAVATYLAGTIVLLISVAPRANATPAINDGPFPLADQVAPVINCAQHSWPHYAQSCLRRPAGDTRQVRVIDLNAR